MGGPGFAGMSRERLLEVSSNGGHTANMKGVTHRWTSKTGKDARRKSKRHPLKEVVMSSEKQEDRKENKPCGPRIWGPFSNNVTPAEMLVALGRKDPEVATEEEIKARHFAGT